MIHLMKYRIKRGKLTGRLHFEGECPSCGAEMTFRRGDIGKNQRCPSCAAAIKPLSAILQKYLLREELDAEQKASKKLREEIQREKLLVAKLREDVDRLRQENEDLEEDLGNMEDIVNDQDEELDSLKPRRPVVTQHVTVEGSSGYHPPEYSLGLAGLLSFFIPGLGQLYAGRPLAAITHFLLTPVGYMLFVIPGFVLHIWSVLDAATRRKF